MRCYQEDDVTERLLARAKKLVPVTLYKKLSKVGNKSATKDWRHGLKFATYLYWGIPGGWSLGPDPQWDSRPWLAVSSGPASLWRSAWDPSPASASCAQCPEHADIKLIEKIIKQCFGSGSGYGRAKMTHKSYWAFSYVNDVLMPVIPTLCPQFYVVRKYGTNEKRRVYRYTIPSMNCTR